MSHGSRPEKRPRTAEDAQELPKHHEEFWLDDGNIVLLARNVAFRVYRGLLAAQSTVFADMFTSSSPNSDETIDGCPVVHLSDSPEDLACLLRVLVPTTQRCYHREKDAPERTFDEVFAVITLAHKYNIEDVQRQALHSLREYTFNDDFAAWKESRNEVIEVYGPCAIGAVNLARLLDVPQMLPIALYKCLELGPDLIDGWTRSDGSVEYLSRDDIKRCITATRTLSVERVEFTYSTLSPKASDGCTREALCQATLRQLLDKLIGCFPESITDASSIMEPWLSGFFEHGLCASCRQEVNNREVDNRENIWRSFPDVFDLEVEDWGKGV